MCPECDSLLASVGYVTLSGMQLQSCMQVPTAACGPVSLKGVNYFPPPAKMNAVPVLQGRVTVKRGKRWVSMEKEDLARMSAFGTTRARAALAGMAVSGAIPCVSDTTERNAFKALLVRVFGRPAHQAQDVAWGVARRFRSLLLPDFHTDIMDDETWIRSCDPKRRKPMRKAMEEYHRYGWRAKNARFKAFVKEELMPDFAKKNCEPIPLGGMVDRLIQAPHDVTHYIAGPALKPLIPALKERWGPDNRIFYASTKLSKIQGWLDARLEEGQGGFLSFASDFSKFDNSHSRESWRFMEEIYWQAGCYMRQDFWRVMRAWRRPAGVITGKRWAIKYRGDVMNASGRDDTSLANGTLNGFASYLSAVAAYLRVPLEDLRPGDLITTPLKLAVCGDDSLGFLPEMPLGRVPEFRARFSANLARFGFDAGQDKIVTTNQPEDLVFLGMRPYPVGGRWLWGRTIGRAVYKLGWTLKPGANLRAWWKGICEQLLYTCKHVPILCDIARAGMAASAGGKITWYKPSLGELEVRPWLEREDPAPPYDRSTISMVAKLYGYPETAVLDLIARIRSLNNFPCVLSDPLLWRMVCYDDQ